MATVIKYKGQKLRVAQDAKTNEFLFATCDIERVLKVTNQAYHKRKVYKKFNVKEFQKVKFNDTKHGRNLLNVFNKEELFFYISGIKGQESKEFANFIKDFISGKYKEDTEQEEKNTTIPQNNSDNINTNVVVINNVDVIFGNSDNGVFCTSLDIAKVFEKEHFHVLRDIKQILSDLREIGDLQCKSNFEFSFKSLKIEGFKGKEKKIPYYNLTRDGFSLLAMGFTGKKALKFKIAFIDTFNQLEKAYFSGIPKKTDSTDLFLKEYLKQQNILHNEILLKLDSMLKLEPDKNKKIEILESKINIQEEQISKLTKELLLSKNEMIELQRWIIRGRKDKQQTRQHFRILTSLTLSWLNSSHLRKIK